MQILFIEARRRDEGGPLFPSHVIEKQRAMKGRRLNQKVGRDASTSLEESVPYAQFPSQARCLRAACLVAALSLTGLLAASALADEGSGSVLSQTGSNGRSQTGSNGRSQTGSNGRAITVADVLSQTGSNGRSQTGSNGRAVVTSAAMGAIERVDSSGQSTIVVVLGQEFAVDATNAGVVAVGDYVLVATGDNESGTTLQKVDEAYIAGVSPVILVGVVDGIDVQTARLTIGGASVDYSSQLSLNPDLLPASGAVYETVGIQPAPGGAILAGLQYDGALVSLSSPQ